MEKYIQPKDRPFRIDLARTAHRPWPIPSYPYAMEMSWHDLLFIHYPVSPQALRPLLPRNLPLDTWESQAWVGIVPFGMNNVRLRGLPALPGAISFPELNVRTYATIDGKPGVYFFSLDTISLAAVMGARTWFKLRYYHAIMEMESRDCKTRFSSERRPSKIGAQFHAQYQPTGPVASFGAFDRWLTERYCLYSAGPFGGIYRADIHHLPWPLQPARANIELNTMATPLGLTLSDVQPILHFSEFINVVAWAPRRVI